MTKPPITNGTKRALIAQVLADDITSGKYPVGFNLPSENELAQSFGVSRQTVRIALTKLRENGLVESRQGVGNIVRSSSSPARYVQAFASLDDLLQYASTTSGKFTGKSEVVITPEMAEWIGCKPGERWWRLTTTRYSKDRSLTIAATEIFIPYLFGSVIKHAVQSGGAIFELLENMLGKTIAEVKQDIQAAKATPEEAAILNIPPQDPVLRIVRHYYDSDGQLLEVTRAAHTSETFSYSMRMRLSTKP